MSLKRSWSPLIDNVIKKIEPAIQKSNELGQMAIWGYELKPFIPENSKDGKEVSGIRRYYVMDVPTAFKMIYEDEKQPEFRNYYEVIFGRCRLFADLDLAIPSIQKATGNAVMGVYTIIDRIVKEKLAEFYPSIPITKIDYCILTAHLDGVKESMHVVWRLYDASGREIIFESIEEVRRFMALCVNLACDSLGVSGTESMLPEDPANPLFDHSKPLHPCILDIGVYNEYRNFRLIHNVKADVITGKKRAWLSDPSCNTLTPAHRGKPATRICMAEFTRHLIRAWDYDVRPAEFVVLPADVIRADIKFAKFKPGTTGKAKKRGPAAQYKASALKAAYEGGTYESLESTLSRMSVSSSSSAVAKIKKWTLRQINRIFQSDEHSVLHDVPQGFTITSDALFCPYKDADHDGAPGVHYNVIITYPLPTVRRKCFKTACIALIETQGVKLVPLDDVSQADRDEYTLLIWEYLSEAKAE
jgi:hypothetical protein